MGKLVGGPWGRVKGKVGNLVAANFNGETVLRTAPTPGDGPPTPAQELHRKKFTLAQNSLRPASELLRITFRNGTVASGLNLAAGYALENAITVDKDNEAIIDFSRVRISRGNLPPADSSSVTNSGTSFTMTWDVQSGYGSASGDDKAVVVVLCPGKNQCFYNMSLATRREGTVTVDVKLFAGREVHAYLAFITANNKKSSDSQYLGSFSLPATPEDAGQ